MKRLSYGSKTRCRYKRAEFKIDKLIKTIYISLEQNKSLEKQNTGFAIRA